MAISNKTGISGWPIPAPKDDVTWFDIGNTIELIDVTINDRFLELNLDPATIQDLLERVTKLESNYGYVECLAAEAKILAQEALDVANGIDTKATEALEKSNEALETSNGFSDDIAKALSDSEEALNIVPQVEQLIEANEDYDNRIKSLENKEDSWDSAVIGVENLWDITTKNSEEIQNARDGKSTLNDRFTGIEASLHGVIPFSAVSVGASLGGSFIGSFRLEYNPNLKGYQGAVNQTFAWPSSAVPGENIVVATVDVSNIEIEEGLEQYIYSAILYNGIEPVGIKREEFTIIPSPVVELSHSDGLITVTLNGVYTTDFNTNDTISVIWSGFTVPKAVNPGTDGGAT